MIFDIFDPDRVLYLIIRIFVILTALPLHELAHGWVAYQLGDLTPKQMGRLTLNPIKHLDLFGSLMILIVGFGYAKPVPVNPNHFKNKKAGMALTALAGPMSNLLQAFFWFVVYRIVVFFMPLTEFTVTYIPLIFETFIFINISLAIFNLLPIPPLDGSRIVDFFLPERLSYYWEMIERKYQTFLMIGIFVLLYMNVLTVPLSFLSEKTWTGLYYLTQFVTYFLELIF